MDLESVRAFVKVAELASFTRAAQQLGLPKSRVSARVRALEEELGSHLLQRTTRAVQVTPDGESFLLRARRLLVEADELSSMFAGPRNLRGRVRVDLPVTIACDVLIPRVPELLSMHPDLELVLSTTDRRVDVVREGFDCVLRIGAMPDSGLIAQRLGTMPMANYASPGYLDRFGLPRTLDDLDRHFVIHYSQSLGSDPPSFEYRDGDRWVERPMRALVTVNSTDAYQAACIAGLGIAQAPRWGRLASVRSSALVEVMPDFTCAPLPVSIVHAHGRNPPRRVRAVTAWIAQLLEPLLTRES
jgi:DNA-binding transcriptional LysR family regulator